MFPSVRSATDRTRRDDLGAQLEAKKAELRAPTFLKEQTSPKRTYRTWPRSSAFPGAPRRITMSLPVQSDPTDLCHSDSVHQSDLSVSSPHQRFPAHSRQATPAVRATSANAARLA
jgi:hypothetical protein